MACGMPLGPGAQSPPPFLIMHITPSTDMESEFIFTFGELLQFFPYCLMFVSNGIVPRALFSLSPVLASPLLLVSPAPCVEISNVFFFTACFWMFSSGISGIPIAVNLVVKNLAHSCSCIFEDSVFTGLCNLFISQIVFALVFLALQSNSAQNFSIGSLLPITFFL